ncbi:MAG: DNA polymerase-3 subunit delta [Flavobacteriaceae bacterium]|jgi:DNA polymerase-3 subunit delta|tara:strand:+ start:314 stop:1318 length:1005 start_codon:yes stop_codon:yes gene_type:complete
MKEFHTLLSKIEKNQFSPFYLLAGIEGYYIDAIADALIGKLVEESSKDFDCTYFYGKEAIPSEIIETAKRYPMISTYNVVIIKEAQFIKKEVLDELISYVENPMPQSVLILCYKNKNFNKGRKLYKAALKTGEVLMVKPLFENQISPWVNNQAKKMKLDVDPKASIILSEFIGANLSALNNELVKLKLAVKEGETVTVEHIVSHVGVSKEFNSFELQKSIGLGQFSKAFQIIQYFGRNPKSQPLVLTLSTLHSYFQKLLILKGLKNPSNAATVLSINPYFVNDFYVAAKRFNMRQITMAMHHVFKADLKSKGIEGANNNSQSILEELLLKLFTL